MMAKQRLTDRSINRKPPASGQIEIWDSVVPGFGLRISYGGKRTYFVMTRIHGRQVRRTVGTTTTHKLAEAREAARDILRDAARGIDPKDREAQERREAARAKRGTFGAVAKDFMDERTGHLRRADEYQRKLDKDLLPQWQDILQLKSVKLHLYGKSEARPGRKMGHVNCLGRTLDEAKLLLDQVRDTLA